MAKYLIRANYVGDGVKGLMKEGGSSRRAAVEKLAESLGGRMESFYYALGDTDAYVIFEAPDNVSAAAASLVANASGAVTASLTVLMTAEEMDEAAKKSPEYQPPGS